MTDDLQKLRKTATVLATELTERQQTWKASGHYVETDDWDDGELLEVVSPQVYQVVLARYFASLTPRTVLRLLDRLERAEKKLAERDTVYPTLMTQVGKEKL